MNSSATRRRSSSESSSPSPVVPQREHAVDAARDEEVDVRRERGLVERRAAVTKRRQRRRERTRDHGAQHTIRGAVIVRIVLWNLADSKTTVGELRRYLADEAVDAFARGGRPAVQGVGLRRRRRALGRGLRLGVGRGRRAAAAVARPRADRPRARTSPRRSTSRRRCRSSSQLDRLGLALGG